MENLIAKTKHILSFAKRDSRLTAAQKEALTRLTDKYVLNILEEQKLDLFKTFSNDNPVVLEIGFGNGDSLLQQAKENPDINFLGIEVYKSGVAKLLMGIEQYALTNIKIISDDALKLLKTNFSDNSFSRIQLFFPDPWPKARHHKRRIVRDEFLKLVSCVLKPNCILHIATDWENYAEHISEIAIKFNMFSKLTKDNLPLHPESLKTLQRPTTKFEKRGINLGHDIFEFYFSLK